MNPIKRLVLGIAGLVLFTVSVAPDAHATGTYQAGYFCSVALYPETYYGDAGMLSVRLTKKPDCQGGTVVHGFVFSVNASSPYANSAYLYSEAQLMVMYGNLQNAAALGQRGQLLVQSNGGSPNDTILRIAFGAD